MQRKKGDVNRALSHLLKAETYINKQSDLEGYLNCLINIGNAYRSKSELNQGLYQKLIAPVKAQLTEDVIVIPDSAKAIVTSIWSVNDAKTKDLMVFFYQNLKRGQPKNEALRQAKLTYLETHTADACHPYFWSGFIGIGAQGAVR